MSLYDYEQSKRISVGLALTDAEPTFYGLLMAVMRRADTGNAARLCSAFPDTWAELDARYNAPGGRLAGDP